MKTTATMVAFIFALVLSALAALAPPPKADATGHAWVHVDGGGTDICAPEVSIAWKCIATGRLDDATIDRAWSCYADPGVHPYHLWMRGRGYGDYDTLAHAKAEAARNWHDFGWTCPAPTGRRVEGER
jgi:hypothetical protein